MVCRRSGTARQISHSKPSRDVEVRGSMIVIGRLLKSFFIFALLATLAQAQIQHVVVVIKENHSFDNYFGQFPGANGATTGNSKTQKGMPLTPMSDAPVNCTH